MKKTFYFLKKGDIIIIFIVFLISIIPLIFLKTEENFDNAKIVVSQDNIIIGEFDLNKTVISKYINFDFKKDDKIYKGTLETKNSMVRLLRLPEEVVPKSIHSDMSWIKDDSKIIVALPVKLTISIENSNIKSKVDAISN